MKTEPLMNAQWIEDGKRPWSGDNFKILGCTIGQCIPPVYESYCKIFHPLHISPDEPDTREPLKKIYLHSMSVDPEAGLIMNVMDENGSITNILDPEIRNAPQEEPDSDKRVPITWKSAAERYGLIFHDEISEYSFINRFDITGWPRNFHLPYPRYLPRPLLIKLLSYLKEASTADLVYIYQMIPHNIYYHKTEDHVSCSFNEVLEYFEDDFVGYLYAHDKSWLVFTDNDLNFTIVGGQKELIDALVSSDMEVIRCNHDTRVDGYADKINKNAVIHENTSRIKFWAWWRKMFIRNK